MDHECATADLAPDEVVFLQEIERGANRCARDAEAARDLALRRKPLTVIVNAVRDGAAKLSRDSRRTTGYLGKRDASRFRVAIARSRAAYANSRPHSALRE